MSSVARRRTGSVTVTVTTRETGRLPAERNPGHRRWSPDCTESIVGGALMKPSEIRRALLAQHANSRIMMDVTQTIAEGARLGLPGRGDLRGCVVLLADALRSHNLREEELL